MFKRGYYLGVEVEALPDFTEGLPPGWVPALWPDGKICIHWAEQIKPTPWG